MNKLLSQTEVQRKTCSSWCLHEGEVSKGTVVVSQSVHNSDIVDVMNAIFIDGYALFGPIKKL